MMLLPEMRCPPVILVAMTVLSRSDLSFASHLPIVVSASPSGWRSSEGIGYRHVHHLEALLLFWRVEIC